MEISLDSKAKTNTKIGTIYEVMNLIYRLESDQRTW